MGTYCPLHRPASRERMPRARRSGGCDAPGPRSFGTAERVEVRELSLLSARALPLATVRVPYGRLRGDGPAAGATNGCGEYPRSCTLVEEALPVHPVDVVGDGIVPIADRLHFPATRSHVPTGACDATPLAAARGAPPFVWLCV